VLEHIAAQGDFEHFFQQFSDFWRILKPDGLFCAAVRTATQSGPGAILGIPACLSRPC